MDWNNKWNWSEFCSTGVIPFANDTNDLLPCFQQTVLQLPICVLLTLFSAYVFGLHSCVVVRNSTQLRMINYRIFLTIALAILPIWKVSVIYFSDVKLYAVDLLMVSTECIMWVVHCGYLFSLRSYGGLSHRGPLPMIVIWLTKVLLDALWLRTSIKFNWWPSSLASFTADLLYALTLLPSGTAFISALNYIENREQEALLTNRYTYFQFDLNETSLGHAQDEASWYSRSLFNWVNPLITKGVAGNLKKIEDLFDLPDALNISYISERFKLALSQSKSLVHALHKIYGWEFYSIGTLRFISDASGFAGPLLLGGLLHQPNEKESDNKAYIYALGLLGTTLISALCGTHFRWRMSIIGLKMRIGVVTSIYNKSLEANELKDVKPEILNLMSTDTDRIVNSCVSFHSLWSIPLQLFTTLYLLYTQLGVAFIGGVIFAAAMIPLNRSLAKQISDYSNGLMKAKDARLSCTSEVVQGVKNIKTNAWENIFIKKILELRANEIKYLTKRKYLDAMCVYFWATTPVLMSFFTFAVSVLLGNPLIASTTYTSVALMNMLIGPLNAFPWVMNGIIEAWISMKRVQELFDLQNLDFCSYYTPILDINSLNPFKLKPNILKMESACFAHHGLTESTESHTFRLQNVNIEVKQGELVCVEGPVGGGKSSFISAIIGEIDCTNGQICIKDYSSGFGYVPQTPWLQRGTIRDNIVWGARFDEQWYKRVLHACALIEDIEGLGGDLVGVGENGRTLSGGQRARVTLARAVYQRDKKIYLMDDILSALDAHVANHIIKHCILDLLKTKTRIVVTHNISLLLDANQIIHIQDGEVTQRNHLNNSIDFVEEIENKELLTRSNNFHEQENIDEKTCIDNLISEETREYGNISLNTISCYWNAIGSPLAIAVLVSVVFMQVSRNFSDAWLAKWVTDSSLNPNTTLNLEVVLRSFNFHVAESQTSVTYLTIYALLAGVNTIVTLTRSFIFAYAGIKAAIFIHDKLLNRVIFTKFFFFDMTSVGRILNRFSSDIYTIDDTLPFITNILLAQIVGLIGVLIISLYAMPLLALVIIPMIPIYINLQHRYRHASRDIKRLSSNALSPLYTHFAETIQGLWIIRTMRASSRFQRDFNTKLEDSIKAQLTAAAAQQWLDLRLQLLGTLLVGSAGFLATITSAHTTNPGLVGLAISYALSVTVLLSGVLNALIETEQELIAVERVNQYLHLDGEEDLHGTVEPPFGWPTQGVISFKNVQLRYREDLMPVLHNISFETEAFERIGIVGRTGAGKSSLLSALLRISPVSKGEIILDCVNLKTLNLRILRERIFVITQEPFLFEGTVRENLDPRKAFYDTEIWTAIKNLPVMTVLVQQLGGLDGHLAKSGVNLSAGQRQILCLTRALLYNAKVVCIDEGTSNLDNDSDLYIHQLLRNSFKSSTILFIAHRLHGLHLMDRILVLENGDIQEQGNPIDLARDTKSIFFSMLQAQKINIENFTNSN